MTNGTGAHVLVVGTGLAGLAAARRLEGLGFETTVLEAAVPDDRQARLGDPAGAEPAIATVPMRTPALDWLLGETDLRDRVRPVPLNAVRLGRHRRPVRLPTAGRLGSVPGLTPLDPLGARRLRRLLAWFGPRLNPDEPEGVGSLDDRSVSEFCALYLGQNLLDRVYAPLLEAHLGLDPEETSRVTLLLLLGPEGGPAVRLAIGLGALVDRLIKDLSDLRAGQRTVGVRSDGSAVELASGEIVRGDAVVLAVPAPEVRRLMPGLSPREEVFFDSCRYVPRHVLVLPSTKESLDQPEVHWIPRSEGGPLSAILRIPASSREPDLEAHTLLVARPDAGARDPADLARSLCSAAAQLDPALSRVDAVPPLRTVPQFAPRFPVGHYQALAGVRPHWHRQLPERRIAFCGDYLVAPHAEGAAVSGVRAAHEVSDLFRGLRATG
jgi:oxygen-dependent protoporphyrinogen oxidase